MKDIHQTFGIITAAGPAGSSSTDGHITAAEPQSRRERLAQKTGDADQRRQNKEHLTPYPRVVFAEHLSEAWRSVRGNSHIPTRLRNLHFAPR